MCIWRNITMLAPTASPELLAEFEANLAQIPDAERRLECTFELTEDPWYLNGEQPDSQPWLRLVRCLRVETAAITDLRQGAALVREAFPSITRLELTSTDNPAQIRRALWRLPNLVELDLTYFLLMGGRHSPVAVLNSLPPVRHLELRYGELPKGSLLAIRRSEVADELRHLDLSGARFSHRDEFTHLSQLPLRSLGLAGLTIEAKELRRLGDGPLALSLQHLDLRGCPKLRDEQWLSRFPALRSCVLDPEQADRWGQLGGHIDVRVAARPRDALDLLPLPPAVTEVIREQPFSRPPPWAIQSSLWWYDPDIHVDEGRPGHSIAASADRLAACVEESGQSLASLERWKVLTSYPTKPPSALLAQLSGLRELDLVDCDWSEFLEFLTHLPRVEKLSIQRRTVGEREINALANSPGATSLRRIDATGVDWQKGAIEALERLELEELILRNCHLPTTALEGFGNLSMSRGLKRLDVRGNADPPASLTGLGIPQLVR